MNGEVHRTLLLMNNHYALMFILHLGR